MAGGGKNEYDIQAKQMRQNAAAAKLYSKNSAYAAATNLEDVTRQTNQALGSTVDVMGKLGAFEYGANSRVGRRYNDITRMNTNPEHVAGFDRDRFTEIDTVKTDIETRQSDIQKQMNELRSSGYDSNGEGEGNDTGWRNDNAKRQYNNLQSELDDLNKQIDDLSDEWGELDKSRRISEQLSTDWKEALGQVGDLDIKVPDALRFATGSNLLNISRSSEIMAKDRSTMIRTAMDASATALRQGENYSEQGDLSAQAADHQRATNRINSLFSGIIGLGGMAAGAGMFGLTRNPQTFLSGLGTFGSAFM